MHTEKFWNDEPSQSLVINEGVCVFRKLQRESITRHRSDLTSHDRAQSVFQRPRLVICGSPHWFVCRALQAVPVAANDHFLGRELGFAFCIINPGRLPSFIFTLRLILRG
jgi:hypothetical protein